MKYLPSQTVSLSERSKFLLLS